MDDASHLLSWAHISALAALALCAACSDPAATPQPASDLGADLDQRPDASPSLDLSIDLDMAPDQAQPALPVVMCEDDAALVSCVGARCEPLRRCRGDELCVDAACVPWQTADLSADFTLARDPEDARLIKVEVIKGGFPRAQVDTLRFDFGDGVAGWDELVSHRYDAPGVYPVTLQVRLDGHRILTKRKLAVIEPGPDHQPLQLTINQLPSYVSGVEPIKFTSDKPSYHFAHHVPRDHFDIDLALLEDPADPLLMESLRFTIELGGVVLRELSPLLGQLSIEGSTLTIPIRADEPLPEGLLTLRFAARTAEGRALERTLNVQSVTLAPAQDPRSRPMIWLMRDDVDFFTTTRTALTGNRYRLDTVEGPDGKPDLLEELRLVGAQGADQALNARYLSWIRAELNKEIYRLFGIGPDGVAHDGIQMKLVWTGEPGAPDPATFDEAGDFSMMRFGGVFASALGYSGYSAHNQRRMDNSTRERGVASAGIISAFSALGVISEALAPLHLEHGVILGAHPHDAQVLDPSFDPYADHPEAALARYWELRHVAQDLGLALAAVTAHEMGHAMGLMPVGLPPEGFFGEVHDCVFIGPRTDSHHADLPGLNLMQAGGNQGALITELRNSVERPPRDLLELVRLLAKETHLSPLSRAYLQGKLTYTNRD